ncbi:hypothetical protein ZEAMMB73_Zm00001d028645 [Zea mays]|uniref:Uncharacterized protein n=1 Tax=Zea mays TaxID=4577 RepID=A0A1D6JY87_MAIZE|nr:hypothetical protein ZEAMMB73_Zm00001d028645 [Zea mays]
MGDLQGLNGATVGFSAADGPEETTEEEDMRGCKGCARRWLKSGLSWGCARSRRWRRGESLHHVAHVTKARPPISVYNCMHCKLGVCRALEPRLFNEGYGFGSRGTPGDCASWKRLLSCQLSYFNFGLTIIVCVPLSSIFYLL